MSHNETTAENKQGGRLSANPLSGRGRETHIVETDDARNTTTTEPTPEQIRKAALRWCGEKDRETFQDDILYFETNWRALPGMRSYVERECT